MEAMCAGGLYLLHAAHCDGHLLSWRAYVCVCVCRMMRGIQERLPLYQGGGMWSLHADVCKQPVRLV